MKISKLFHTLYGCLMALPVLVIPIFAININQKSVEPISIEVQEIKYYASNIVEETSDIRIGNIYKWNDAVVTGEFTVRGAFNIYCDIDLFKSQYTQYEHNDITQIRMYQDSNLNIYYELSGNNMSTIYINMIGTPSYFIPISLNVQNMTIEVLNHIVYTDYQYTKGLQYHTYDNTDIGSQFLYSIYKPVNDYFNFKDFMGLGSLYDWIQLNIFSGSNSLVFFILFNLFTYWIFVSFFWLIFDVLMYVPSLVHKMLDKARLE